MKNNYFFSDLDGTLISNNKLMSKDLIKEINNLIDYGLNFSIATSRSFLGAKKFLQDINFNIPLVFLNGAIITDKNGKIFLKKELKRNDYHYILNHIITQNGIPVVITYSKKEKIYSLINVNGCKIPLSLNDLFDLNNIVAVYGVYNSSRKIVLNNRLQEYHFDKMIQYVDKDVCKYNGIKYISGENRIVFFGDDKCDIEAIIKSDFGFIVGNKININNISKLEFDNGASVLSIIKNISETNY